MKKLLSIIFMFISINSFAQLDSSIVYVDEKPTWKTIYDNEYTYFYKKDSIDNWYLYAKWEDSDYERIYMNYDSLGNEITNWKTVWDESKMYSYSIDSLGNEELVATTEYYGEHPITGTTTGDDDFTKDGIEIYVEYNDIISITATEILNKIYIYNIEGQLIYKFEPNVQSIKIVTHTKGLLVVKILYNNTKYINKKLIILQ